MTANMTPFSIRPVGAAELSTLLPLMRAYCDFYRVSPPDDALLALSNALIADPNREGVQLLAVDAEGRGAGFATIFWTWSTLEARRIGVMNDLYVAAWARRQGLAERLIDACRQRCALRGVTRLAWQTAPGNAAARALYDRVGAVAEQWVDYWLEIRRADS